MTMKIHKLIEGKTNYPIGDHIESNLPVITSMGDCLVSVLEQYYSKHRRVNLLCRGSSGAIIAAIVTAMLIKAGYGTSIIHIKKLGENSHRYNGFWRVLCIDAINVIIDDFIITGATINAIIEAIDEDDTCRKVIFDILCVTGPIRVKIIPRSRFKYAIKSK